MKEKTQYEALIEELQKKVENFRDGVIEIGERLSKLLPDIEIPEEEEDTWEMKCPYRYDDEYFYINTSGNVFGNRWCDFCGEEEAFASGNTFLTKEAAELEAKRRNLLTRFRAFRDECNGDWKMCWSNYLENKYYIGSELEGIGVCSTVLIRVFPIFGYFKTREDAERAIELFGDEIIELYVNNEV